MSAEQEYREFFRLVTEHDPYHYQVKVGLRVVNGESLIVRAPTGAGKTNAVLIPFLFPSWAARPHRLIYALPLRTLAQGIYHEAQELVEKLGHPVEAQIDAKGREIAPPYVTLQTGEQPDDPFFDRGKIIVTTYDQVLSGLLDGPYGLSNRLHNVNAAAIAGALVVFDEFHLMEQQRAFLTAVACLRLFRGLCQSVWMTATATEPLERTVRDALGALCVPETEQEKSALYRELPSVREVTRRITWEPEPLSAESVLGWHSGRTILLLNTVGRSQAMFEALQDQLKARRLDVKLVLLHSRFFKADRRAKEECLRSVFGKDAKGPAILVATQVVEAGLDITCDHLHTELCPMNALVQRAGRCARFAGESGTVHVYPLPPEDRAWLPYGDSLHEDPAMTKTRNLLEGFLGGDINPSRAADWVQQVHAVDDELALRSGWRVRLDACLRLIQQNAFLRDPGSVAELIRGKDTDSIRVIVGDETTRPETPGQREGLNLSRWSLARLLRDDGLEVGWFWDGSEDEPWKPLKAREDLQRTYAVCMRPEVAAYDGNLGLRLGLSGSESSPIRAEPERPGYAALRAETWEQHAKSVAAEARRRLGEDAAADTLLGAGFEKTLKLSPVALMEAVVACGHLHDLGKLQDGWQRWAEEIQRTSDEQYQHSAALAHTDFGPDRSDGYGRGPKPAVRRPPHAPASAYYGRAFVAHMLPSVPDSGRLHVASACMAAVLAHHGGWWPGGMETDPPRLWPAWETAAKAVIGWAPDREALASLRKYRVEQLLEVTTDPDKLEQWWPLVSFLTRTLRLSDQRAMAEGAIDG